MSILRIISSYIADAITAMAGLAGVAYMMGYEEKYVFYAGISGILIFAFLAVLHLYEIKKK